MDSGDTALFIICDEPLPICKSHWGFKVIEWFIYKKNNWRDIPDGETMDISIMLQHWKCHHWN